MIFPLCSAIAETKKSRAYGLKFQPSSNNALLGTSSVGESGTAWRCILNTTSPIRIIMLNKRNEGSENAKYWNWKEGKIGRWIFSPELEQLVLPDPIQRQKRACPYLKVFIFPEESICSLISKIFHKTLYGSSITNPCMNMGCAREAMNRLDLPIEWIVTLVMIDFTKIPLDSGSS